MRTKVLLSFLPLLIFALPVLGQNWRTSTYEVNLGIGAASYFGDIGGSSDVNTWYGIKDLDIKRSRPVMSGGIRYMIRRNLAVNGGLHYAWLSGSDAGGRNDQRGYVFNTIIFEPSARIEFFPIVDYRVLDGVNRRGLVRRYGTLSVYLYGGAGALVYHVMPNENLEARQERDNIDYSPVTLVLPAGIGMKVGISNTMDIGFDLGGRYVLNDYLDGFTSPASTSNDIYYLTTVQLTYRLPRL